MSTATIEERVAALEATVAKLVRDVVPAPVEPDWRSTVGMFRDDPLMQEIDTEGQRIREADREQARRDHS